MRPGDGGVAAVTNINVMPLFSRAEQLPFKIPVHVPGDERKKRVQEKSGCFHINGSNPRAACLRARLSDLAVFLVLAPDVFTEAS